MQCYASAASALGSIYRLKTLHHHTPSGMLSHQQQHTNPSACCPLLLLLLLLFTLSIGAPAKAVQRYASAASALGSIERLKALHYHAPSGTFRDYGLHTEAVEMVWRDVQVPEGQPPQVRAAVH